jgi:D-alanyl-D-alanine carboxypeptidase
MCPMSIRAIRRLAALSLALAIATATGLAIDPVSAASLPSCRVADTMTAQATYAAWDRTVLDTTYRLKSTYAPGDLRSTANAGLTSGYRVRAIVIVDLRAMATAARKAGARLAIQSAYRSYSTQRVTFAYWTRLSGLEAALDASARPGHSEHQLGTALDFRSYGGGAPWNLSDWAKTKAGAWLKNNAWRYGFVMSYPKGKSSVTCYTYEPWHYRYVGRAVAAKVRASGLTLREYLWRQQSAVTPTPTPTPTPTLIVDPTPTPTSDPTPVIDPTPDPTLTTDPTPTPDPTATPDE